MHGLLRQQKRCKATSARLPPWRRWVRGREAVPQISWNRSLNIKDGSVDASIESASAESELLSSNSLTTTGSSLLQSTDGIGQVSLKLDSLRKFLLPSSPLAGKVRKELDKLCDDLADSLSSMSVVDKVKVMCAFGQLREYSVVNRVADRYNARPLVYDNQQFYSRLCESVDWSSLYQSELSGFKSLSPTLHILRSLNRMPLTVDQKQVALSHFFDGMLESSNGVLPGTPKQLTELVMIASKNRLAHANLFSSIVLDIESNHSSYSEDLIGDLARSFTTLAFYSEPFHRVLKQQLPLVSHELSWWNLIDIADYFNVVVEKPFDQEDMELVTRLANELWKCIPDMRSGYTAKGLRVLSELGIGDKRTIRSLIRHIPRSLGKLHKNVTAETLIAATKVGYSPRQRYGKRYGSVFYRRLAAHLTAGNSSPLKTVSADLIVKVVEALRAINRPQNELFEFIISDIKTSPGKYSENHLISLDRLGVGRGNRLGELSQSIMIENLAYLAKSDEEAFRTLMLRDSSERCGLTVAELAPLLTKPEMHAFVESEWLDMNLSNLTGKDLTALTEAFALNRCALSTLPLRMIMERASSVDWDNLDDLVLFIASTSLLNGFKPNLLPSNMFDLVARKSTMSLPTLKLCQLIAGHIRLNGQPITDSVSKFISWIEAHLVSKYPQPEDRMEVQEFYVPNGAVTDLSVFPVCVPLAVPDPRIDLHKLHHSRTSVAVRRALKEYQTDAGIALMFMSDRSVETLLSEQYLRRLGWTVKYIRNGDNIADPQFVTQLLLSNVQPSEPQRLVYS